MNLPSGINRDFLRTVTTTLAPGCVVLTPYALLACHYSATLCQIAKANYTFSSFLFFFVGACVGMILEDFGSWYETKYESTILNPKKCSAEKTKYDEDWYDYLLLKTSDEIVGMKYISAVVSRMKFELSFAFALFISIPAIIWLQQVGKLFEYQPVYWVLLALMFFVTCYLFKEAKNSMQLLASTRKEIVARLNASPKPPVKTGIFEAICTILLRLL